MHTEELKQSGKLDYTRLSRFLEAELGCDHYQAARFAWHAMRHGAATSNDGVLFMNPDDAMRFIRECAHEGVEIYNGVANYALKSEGGKVSVAPMANVVLSHYCKRCGLLVKQEKGPAAV